MINNTTRESLCIFVFWPLNPNLINPNTQQSQACLWEHAVANSAVTVASLPSSSGKNLFPYGRNSPGNTGLGQVVPGHCPCLYPCTAVKTCSGPTSGSISRRRRHRCDVTTSLRSLLLSPRVTHHPAVNHSPGAEKWKCVCMWWVDVSVCSDAVILLMVTLVKLWTHQNTSRHPY